MEEKIFVCDLDIPNSGYVAATERLLAFAKMCLSAKSVGELSECRDTKWILV